MCSRFNVPICRSGSKSSRDLSVRTCWEDHMTHGLPIGRGAFRVGSWAEDYDELQAGAQARPAKRRRASTGQMRGAGVV